MLVLWCKNRNIKGRSPQILSHFLRSMGCLCWDTLKQHLLLPSTVNPLLRSSGTLAGETPTLTTRESVVGVCCVLALHKTIGELPPDSYKSSRKNLCRICQWVNTKESMACTVLTNINTTIPVAIFDLCTNTIGIRLRVETSGFQCA